jgi:hypothetical protein
MLHIKLLLVLAQSKTFDTNLQFTSIPFLMWIAKGSRLGKEHLIYLLNIVHNESYLAFDDIHLFLRCLPTTFPTPNFHFILFARCPHESFV